MIDGLDVGLHGPGDPAPAGSADPQPPACAPEFSGADPGGAAPESGAWPACPRVALIVPLTGNSPEMEAALESLLNQPYPNYETVLVTRDLEDPATPLVRALLARHPHSRHIVSGPAAGCSQKNHNILAGVGALDDSVEILVFCDSTHQAQPNFLRELIHPLVTGAASLTSGFHRIIPGDARVPTLGTAPDGADPAPAARFCRHRPALGRGHRPAPVRLPRLWRCRRP